MPFFFKIFTGKDLGLSSFAVMVIDAVLVLTLVICAVTDAKTHKILNKVTFPTMLAGLLLNGLFGAVNNLGVKGFIWSLVGLLVGLGIQWVPFMLGLAKAGDVKLLGAVGALKGWAFCCFGFLYGAAAFLFLSLPWLLKEGELGRVGRNLKHYAETAVLTQSAPDAPTPVVTKKFVPWGVSLAAGFFIALIVEILFDKPFWF